MREHGSEEKSFIEAVKQQWGVFFTAMGCYFGENDKTLLFYADI